MNRKLLISKILYKQGFGSAGEQKLYGIVQGGTYDDLREESIDFNVKRINYYVVEIVW